MLLDEERHIFHLLLENIEAEFYRNLPSDELYWQVVYQNIPLEKRKEFWWIIIGRYEHMVHGEFNPDSITYEANHLVKVLKSKDIDNQVILKYLYNRLINNMLQVDEISQYMAIKIKEINGDFQD